MRRICCSSIKEVFFRTALPVSSREQMFSGMVAAVAAVQMLEVKKSPSVFTKGGD
jgi:hypothetical protein